VGLNRCGEGSDFRRPYHDLRLDCASVGGTRKHQRDGNGWTFGADRWRCVAKSCSDTLGFKPVTLTSSVPHHDDGHVALDVHSSLQLHTLSRRQLSVAGLVV